MNRAERRKQKKEGKPVVREKVYTLTQSQIDHIKAEATGEAVNKAFMLMLAIPVMVLHDKYWEKTAKKRLPKFVDYCLDLYDSVEKDYVTFDELRECLWEESGIKVERSGEYQRYYGGKNE